MTALIGIEVVRGTYAGRDKPFRINVYGGNAQGEVYIYEVANLDAALANDDDSAPTPQAQLILLDMILTNEPLSTRQVTQVGDAVFALCTENNKVKVVRHNP